MYKNPLDERARESRRKHYHANKEQYYARNKASLEACLEYLREAKDVPCMDCGVKYPTYVMDFDHRDPKAKKDCVPRMARHGMKRLKEEIDKCDIVCSNCHRERTHRGYPTVRDSVSKTDEK